MQRKRYIQNIQIGIISSLYARDYTLQKINLILLVTKTKFQTLLICFCL
jgi:hypothetical protein